MNIKKYVHIYFLKNREKMGNHIEGVKGRHAILNELICHFPYAVFSVAFSLIILMFFDFVGLGLSVKSMSRVWFNMFHGFHFIHITFAAVGSLVTYLKMTKSKHIVKGLIFCGISATAFCMLSDIIFPYFGAVLLGANVKLHICFFHEFNNIFPFLIVGLLVGLALSYHSEHTQGMFGLSSHFSHIFISSLASSFYMVSSGVNNLVGQIGYIFLVLILAVVIPCTLSDIAFPMFLAKLGKKR